MKSMVTREITVGELVFLRGVLESYLEEDIASVDVGQAVELVDALINYKEPVDAELPDYK